MIIIAGIDPSMKNTAVITSDPLAGPEAFNIKCFNSPTEASDMRTRIKRYEGFVGEITNYLVGMKVTHIFLEAYAYAAQGSVIALAELGGILRWHLCDEELFPFAMEVTPNQLKKFATGKGNADKVGVVSAIARTYNVALHSSDEHDAYALWRIGRCYLEIDQPRTKDAASVIESLKTGVTPKRKDVKQPRAKPAPPPPPSADMPF